jgi:hypothetical protein
MSISGIPISTFSPYQLGTPANIYQQNFQKLGQDLQSGNLSSAQSDFATLQQAFAQPSTTSGTAAAPTSTATSNPITQAFNQLASDLQSGNLAAAQKDYSTLQQDLQSQSGMGHHLHNHYHMRTGDPFGGANNPSSADSTTQPSLLQEPTQIGQSLTSGNLTAAQQTYATLQQELDPNALGSGTFSTASESPISLEA